VGNTLLHKSRIYLIWVPPPRRFREDQFIALTIDPELSRGPLISWSIPRDQLTRAHNWQPWMILSCDPPLGPQDVTLAGRRAVLCHGSRPDPAGRGQAGGPPPAACLLGRAASCRRTQPARLAAAAERLSGSWFAGGAQSGSDRTRRLAGVMCSEVQ